MKAELLCWLVQRYLIKWPLSVTHSCFLWIWHHLTWTQLKWRLRCGSLWSSWFFLYPGKSGLFLQHYEKPHSARLSSKRVQMLNRPGCSPDLSVSFLPFSVQYLQYTGFKLYWNLTQCPSWKQAWKYRAPQVLWSVDLCSVIPLIPFCVFTHPAPPTLHRFCWLSFFVKMLQPRSPGL